MTPLEERAALFAEGATVQQNADLATRAQAEAAHALAGLELRSVELHQDRARGRVDGDAITAFERERSQARQAVRLADEAAVGALNARRAIEQELQELYARELTVFAAEAEEATQRAAAALEAARAPYQAAHAAWSAAQSRWRPLTAALAGQIERSFTERGEYPDPRRFAQLARVPDSPLREGLPAGVAARPIGLTPAGTPAAPSAW